jgi:RNA polymerase subunit RPABC4/transcription elongation factor Spt4
MLPLAYFGIESNAFNLVVDLLILFVAVLYLSLIYWTYADARRRIQDPMLIACATVASLFPFVGTLVYLILRPPEYLEDVHERELETRAAEARLHQLDHSLCPHCDYPVERDFVRCPSCLRKLKERCVNCSKPLDRAWTICPYCETEVPDLAPRRRTRRRAAEEPASGEPATRAGEGSARPVRGSVTGIDSELARESVALSEPPAPDEPSPRPRNDLDRKGTHGPHPDPREARRLRPLADRRDHRALRAQGPATGRAAPDGRRPGARRAPLRRARPAALLR